MAVTHETSAEVALIDGATVVPLPPDRLHGRLRVAECSFTQGADAGDAGSTATLFRLPPGRVKILGHLSELSISAFGANRVLDIGHAAYVTPAGDAVVADATALDDDLDVAAASSVALGSETEDGSLVIESRDGVDILATVAGGTLPAAATVDGHLVYVAD